MISAKNIQHLSGASALEILTENDRKFSRKRRKLALALHTQLPRAPLPFPPLPSPPLAFFSGMSIHISTLMDLGISAEKSVEALHRCEDNMERAIEWLFSEEVRRRPCSFSLSFLLLELNQMSLQGIAWNEGSIPTAPYYPTFPAVGPLPAGKDVRFDSSVDKGELNSSHHPFLAASPFLSSPF